MAIKVTELSRIEHLPLELKFVITSLLDIDGLYNLEHVSRSWADIVRHGNAPTTTENEIRIRLLKLYRRFRASSVWQILRDDMSQYYPEPATGSTSKITGPPRVDKISYLSRFDNTNIGDEFRQWIMDWPTQASVGFLSPELLAYDHLNGHGGVFKSDTSSWNVPDPKWWFISKFNGLSHYQASPEKFFIHVPEDHALRKMSKEERKSKGWGGFSKSEHGRMAVKVLNLQTNGYRDATYIYVDGMGDFNGTVWKDLTWQYRWNDKLDTDEDEHCAEDLEFAGSAYPDVTPTGWIEWLGEEIGRLEIKYQENQEQDRRVAAGEEISQPYDSESNRRKNLFSY